MNGIGRHTQCIIWTNGGAPGPGGRSAVISTPPTPGGSSTPPGPGGSSTPPTPGLSLQLADDPAGGVRRQVREVGEKLLHVGAGDAGAEVLAQELVEARGDPLGEESAAPERRDDETLDRPEPPSVRELARDLLALVVKRAEHRDRIDAHLLPDSQQCREEALIVPVDQRPSALDR